jgi:hypothetical protein
LLEGGGDWVGGDEPEELDGDGEGDADGDGETDVHPTVHPMTAAPS